MFVAANNSIQVMSPVSSLPSEQEEPMQDAEYRHWRTQKPNPVASKNESNDHDRRLSSERIDR